MSRLPIRLRLTAAFALATALVLLGAALFVHARLRADLDEAVDEALARGASGGDPEEGFFQLVASDGRVLAGVRRPVLTGGELRRAAAEPVVLERRVAGVDGRTRVLARPAPGGGVAVAGRSLEDRDETLADLRRAFIVGGPLAILAASLLGYALAAAGLAPVERMRRRAAEVSLGSDHELLPLPAAHDEVRRLGDTLNEMLGRLRRSFERERRFVAEASHELRTPVAVIKTELEGALRAGPEPRAVREALVAAIEECDHLAQLAEDMLVLARAAEGELPVRPEALPARAELDRARERFADRASHASRTIEVRADDGLELWADPQRLRQALGNLLDNALRHGAGPIVVTARRGPVGAEIEVRDGGPGFAPGLADHAFERFARGPDAREERGAGLGLAIVQAIAEAHGGDVEVLPGAGAGVLLRLPHTGLS